jgi:hypothetical protein
LNEFAHPGDRNYRDGLVIFEKQKGPEFQTVWQLFQFFDTDESGHISMDEFHAAAKACRKIAGISDHDFDLQEAWSNAGGHAEGYINFRQFISWFSGLGVDLPVGLEASGASRPCRFRHSGGSCCSCAGLELAPNGLCASCGHKPSMHRSDHAERCFSDLLSNVSPTHWAASQEGLVPITDSSLLHQLEDLLTGTHKSDSDNWTRDRGCSLHGVNACSAACASKHRSPVPSGYRLVTAYRNQNIDLWQKYMLCKDAISQECRQQEAVPFQQVNVKTSDLSAIELPLDKDCNEWRLFHGSSFEACRGICSTNFRPALAGTGATWKEPGKAKGMPLYGYGVYFSERVTKADEYAEVGPSGEEFEGLHCMLVCRVVGGRTNIITTNEIEIEKLRADVFDGLSHSVFGDRVKTLGKPYREIVAYDKDQCYPEYLLVYERNFG